MKKIVPITVLLMMIPLMTACMAGPNSLAKTPDQDGDVAGFFLGLWHGAISPITFLFSIFTRSIQFYEVHNSGTWYNFGFVLGAGLFFSGGILGSKKKNK
jgi:hypothetical protein